MHCRLPVQAGAYYSKSGSLTHLGEALLHDDDFPGMEKLCAALPEQHAMLLLLGAHFQAAGLVQQAVDAFCKVPDRLHCPMLVHLGLRAPHTFFSTRYTHLNFLVVFHLPAALNNICLLGCVQRICTQC